MVDSNLFTLKVALLAILLGYFVNLSANFVWSLHKGIEKLTKQQIFFGMIYSLLFIGFSIWILVIIF